jgi:excisionase family DNA binding protein
MLLTVAEAADRLRVHPDTVRRRIRAGLVRAHKAPGRNGHVLVPEEAIQEYLKAHQMMGAK